MKAAPQFAHAKRQAVKSFQRFLGGGGFPAHPLEIFLEVSNICNMKCAMCSVFSELNPKRLYALKSSERGFLPEHHIRSLQPLLSHALLVHCYGYGEPTIHPRFAELLDFLLAREVMVDFFTNGMNLTEELCAFLVDRQIFRITVSISGTSRADYENMYLDGDYERVLAGLERIARLKELRGSRYPSIEINSIAFQHHVDQLPQFVDQMAARGVNAIHLKPLHIYGALPELHAHIAVMRPWHEGKLIEEARRRAEQHGVRLVDEFSNVATVDAPAHENDVRRQLLWGSQDVSEIAIPLGDFKSRARSVQAEIPPKRTGRRSAAKTAMDQTPETVRPFLKVRPLDHPPEPLCYEPFKTFYVNQQGGVRPCCFGFTDTHLGNIDTHPAPRIWNGIGFRTVRRAITNGRYPMSICKACLKQKSYPKQFDFAGMVEAYAAWFEQIFGRKFSHDANYFAQLFVDAGVAFNEYDSVILPILPGFEQHLEFDVSGFPEMRALRLDPINVPARVTILRATAVGAEGREFRLAVSPLNGSTIDGTDMLFQSDDPQIRVDGFPGRGCSKIRVSLRCNTERPAEGSGSDR